MEYFITLPDRISKDYFNLGIDFAPMAITGTHIVTNQEHILISLRAYCITLDNRYIKEYSSVQTVIVPSTTASFEYRYEKPLDPREKQEIIEFIIPDEGFVLVPNEVYLYACNERIGCKKNICAQVQAKSSLGRLGLDIVIGPAGFIDTGFEGSLVLELRATRPIIVYPNMKICQIKFERVEGDILESYDAKSGSKYMNQVGVQESLMHKNFKQ
jgi:dCTP deaminase